MSNYDNWKELATDLQITVEEQAESLKTYKLLYRLADDERKALRTQLLEIERKRGNTVQPVIDGDMAECGECCAPVEEDFYYCPGCGKHIDWTNPIEDEADDDTREEDPGEAFLRQEVFEPLRAEMMEAMS